MPHASGIAGVARALQIREVCGGEHSGQWLFASPAASPGALPSALRNGLHAGPAVFVATAVASYFQAALALDERASSTHFLRRTHPAFDAIVALLVDLHDGNHGDDGHLTI
jgi:hypothetical protein